MRARAVALLASSTALLSCAELLPIELDVCGNQVLEPDRGEDCDTFPSETETAPAGKSLGCGAADDARACLYVCAADGDGPSCPVGWTCNPSNGTCNKPALAFELAPPVTLSVFPDDVSFADFDGNGLHDLAFFSGSDLVLRYATGGGGFGAEVVDGLGLSGVGRAYGLGAAVGRFDGDSVADIVAPTPGGAMVLRGTPSQTMTAVPYPATVLPVPARVTNLGAVEVHVAGVLEAQVAFVADLEGLGPERAQTLLFVGTPGQFEPLSEARVQAPDVIGGRVLATGDLDGDGNTEVAIAYQGARTVRFAAAVLRDGRVRMVERAELDVDVGTELYQFVAIADADGDGDRDLIAEVRSLGGLGVVVALWDGQRFGPPRAVATEQQLGAVVGVGVVAAGDFDGDRAADLVVSGREVTAGADAVATILLTRGAADAYRVESLPSGALGQAVTGDFNRDGQLDLAGLSAVTGISVFLGDGRGHFNPGRVETGVAVHTLRAADFDGDFATDLLYAEEAGVAATPTGMATALGAQRLSVAYGRVQGFPSGPIAVADVSTPDAVVPMPFLDHDLIADLVVLSPGYGAVGGLPTVAFYAFRGDSDRRLRATLGIAGAGRPLAGVWMGDFDRTADGTDLLAFSLEAISTGGRSPPLWGMTAAELAAADVQPGKAITLGACATEVTSAEALRAGALVAVSLDGADGTPEALAPDLLVRFGASGPNLPVDQLGLRIIDVRLDEHAGFCTIDTLPALGLGEVRRARVADADGDGRTDLVMVQDPAPEAASNGVTIRWSSHLDARASGRLGISTADYTAVVAPDGDYINDVALGDYDADGRADLVAATTLGLYVAFQAAPRQFTAFAFVGGDIAIGMGGRPALSPEPDPVVRPLTRVFAEDFDRDGITDVLLVRGQSVLAYRGLAIAHGLRSDPGTLVEVMK